MYPVLDVQQLFSGQGRLKASFSNNGLSPCQQKPCQSQCQLGMAPMLAVDNSRASKHNVCVCVVFFSGGVPVYRWLCQDFHQFAFKQPVTHCTLLLPLLSCCWSKLGASPENFLCMHRSIRHALMFYIYSQTVHKTGASNVSPQVSFKGGQRTAHVCSTLIKNWRSRRDNNIFVDLLNWCLPFCLLN